MHNSIALQTTFAVPSKYTNHFDFDGLTKKVREEARHLSVGDAIGVVARTEGGRSKNDRFLLRNIPQNLLNQGRNGGPRYSVTFGGTTCPVKPSKKMEKLAERALRRFMNGASLNQAITVVCRGNAGELSDTELKLANYLLNADRDEDGSAIPFYTVTVQSDE